MAVTIAHDITYVGAETSEVNDLGDVEVWGKYKQDLGFYNPADIWDITETASGFNGWSIDRMSPLTVRYSAQWETQEDYDAWKSAAVAAGYPGIADHTDWDVSSV
jgi:hypothetical protein